MDLKSEQGWLSFYISLICKHILIIQIIDNILLMFTVVKISNTQIQGVWMNLFLVKGK